METKALGKDSETFFFNQETQTMEWHQRPVPILWYKKIQDLTEEEIKGLTSFEIMSLNEDELNSMSSEKRKYFTEDQKKYFYKKFGFCSC